MGRKAALRLLTATALLLPLAAVGPSAAYGAVTTPVRANANGGALTDSAGNSWSADRAHSAGSWGYDTRYGSGSTANPIAGTTDDALYQTYNLFHNGAGYKFDVANGTYQVTLKMMEDWATAAGHRRFDVRIEGTTVLTAFDIFASCGRFTACDRTFTATVGDGQLNIGFTMNGGANYGTVSAGQVTGGRGGGDTTPPHTPAELRLAWRTSSLGSPAADGVGTAPRSGVPGAGPPFSRPLTPRRRALRLDSVRPFDFRPPHFPPSYPPFHFPSRPRPSRRGL